MPMKKTILAAMLATVAWMASAAEMKIGFVNTERVFREAAPARRAQQVLEREFSVRNTELARVEKQGRDLRVGAGLAISWDSPVGPLRFSFGAPIVKKDGDKIERFQFQLGKIF